MIIQSGSVRKFQGCKIIIIAFLNLFPKCRLANIGCNVRVDTFKIIKRWIDAVRCEQVSQTNNINKIFNNWKFLSISVSI